jgi:hypothetical protein
VECRDVDLRAILHRSALNRVIRQQNRQHGGLHMGARRGAPTVRRDGRGCARIVLLAGAGCDDMPRGHSDCIHCRISSRPSGAPSSSLAPSLGLLPYNAVDHRRDGRIYPVLLRWRAHVVSARLDEPLEERQPTPVLERITLLVVGRQGGSITWFHLPNGPNGEGRQHPGGATCVGVPMTRAKDTVSKAISQSL